MVLLWVVEARGSCERLFTSLDYSLSETHVAEAGPSWSVKPAKASSFILSASTALLLATQLTWRHSCLLLSLAHAMEKQLWNHPLRAALLHEKSTVCITTTATLGALPWEGYRHTLSHRAQVQQTSG